jgi:outer membrane receptor protein involved in Fe transport
MLRLWERRVFASDQPAAVAPAQPQQDVIEIVGTRPGQLLKIDRRTYQVNQTPNSAQKDTYQLLRGIPAVTIAADETIQLLGTPNVTIQIDGRSARPELLRTLHGSDIDKIEVITNPSAQYSASGSGGIINFVLRKKRDDGVSGNASIEGGTLGNVTGTGSIKIKRGKWTYEANTWSRTGRQSHSSYHKLRSIEEVEGGPAVINTEDGSSSYRNTRAVIHGKLTYDLDPRTSLVAEFATGGSDIRSRMDSVFRGLTPGFDSFTQSQRATGSQTPFFRFSAALDHKGKKDGETLKASGIFFAAPNMPNDTVSEFDNGDFYTTHIADKRVRGAVAKVDWEHPLGKAQLLSMGASWTFDADTRHYAFTSNGTTVSLGPDTIDQFSGSISTLAAYATFQQPIGSWTVMPGVRAERSAWYISSPNRPDEGRTVTKVFPTLHVDHKLSKTLQLTLSYSKRTDRPWFDQVQPYAVVEGPLAIRQGNPDLKDQSTDSFELNLHYHRKSLDAGVIAYDREIANVWTTRYSVSADGGNIATPFNVGQQSDRGVEFDVSTPIIKRVKVSASINLFASRVPIDFGLAGTRHHDTFRYTTNTTLEWDGPQRGKTPGDIAQLQVQTWSPSRDFQFHRSAQRWVTFSYTHSFGPTLSVTGTAENVLMPSHSRHRLLAPLVQEDYDSRDAPTVKIKLLKTFGKN